MHKACMHAVITWNMYVQHAVSMQVQRMHGGCKILYHFISWVLYVNILGETLRLTTSDSKIFALVL